jgi:N utilization substance protein B
VAAKAERRSAARVQREPRHRGREAAVQMLYQWEIGHASVVEINHTFWPQLAASGEPLPDDLRVFASRLTAGVIAGVEEIDPMIAEAAQHWRIDRLILRLAIYEFLHEKETPPKVVINEALELARTFSTDEAVRFINGILDAIRKRLQQE